MWSKFLLLYWNLLILYHYRCVCVPYADNFIVVISAELLEELFSQIFQMHMLDIFAHLFIDAASYLICYIIKGLPYVATPILWGLAFIQNKLYKVIKME